MATSLEYLSISTIHASMLGGKCIGRISPCRIRHRKIMGMVAQEAHLSATTSGYESRQGIQARLHRFAFQNNRSR